MSWAELTLDEQHKIHEARSAGTVKKNKDGWIRQIRENADVIKNDISKLWREEGGGEILNVSAGPSLKESIGEIASFGRGKTIVAADAAYKFLLDNGIESDFVVSSDASEKISQMFQGVPETKAKLVLNVIANPEFAKSWKGETYWFVMANNIVDDERGNLIQEVHSREARVGGKLVPGGNVSSVMLGLSLSILNADKIYLYGHDFCWNDDFYCGGAFKNLADERMRMEGNAKTIFETENTKGEKVLTNLSLWQFARWHVEALQHMRHRVVNRTPSTILKI